MECKERFVGFPTTQGVAEPFWRYATLSVLPKAYYIR